MPCKRKPGSEGASDGKTRRKIDGEGRALRSGPHQVERAAMAAHDLGRDREPETRAALARAAMERLAQVIERLFRHRARPAEKGARSPVPAVPWRRAARGRREPRMYR